MDFPKKRRRQFGLRALLAVVTIMGVGAAIYRAITQREVLPGLRVGTSRDEVQMMFGEPKMTIGDGSGRETWAYCRPVNVGNDKLKILYGGGDQRLIEQLHAREVRIEFLDGRVIGANIQKLVHE